MGRIALAAVLAAWLTASSVFAKHQPRVVSFPVTRHDRREKHRLHHDDEALYLAERDGTVSSPLINDVEIPLGIYIANVTAGTPAQPVSLIVDTGSSDVWMFGPNSCTPRTSLSGECLGGIFQSSESTSNNLLEKGGFEIRYGQKGSHVSGDIVKDDFTIGGTTVKGLQMGVASDTAQVSYGIMGIGFAQGEAQVRQNGVYPNLPDQLVKQGLIGSKTYSIWLNSIEEPEGNILFGGYDQSKFDGDLVPVPIRSLNGVYRFMAIDWTGLSLDFGGGQNKPLTTSRFNTTVIMDSGTTAILVPEEAFIVIAREFRVQFSRTLGPVLDCDQANTPDSVDFTFGGSGGPTIKVPFSQLAIPVRDGQGNPLVTPGGLRVCQFRVQPNQPNLPTIFGTSLLSSAYVLFDLDKHQISFAQAKFGVKETDIHELNYSGGSSSTGSGGGSPSATSGPSSGSGGSGSGGDANGDGGNGNNDNAASVTRKITPQMLLILAATLLVSL